MKKSNPKSFNIYYDTFEHIKLLDMEQRGELLTALYEYAIDETFAQFDDGMLQMAFSFMRAQMSRDKEKYRQRCEANRANASKRSESKQTQTDDCGENETQRTEAIGSDRYRSVPKCSDGSQEEEEKEEEKEEQKENKKEEEKEEQKENKEEEEEEEEEEKNLSDSLSDSLSADKNDFSSAAECFNRICPEMLTVDTITQRRREAIAGAVNILGGTSFDELFDRVQRSDFLSGRSGKWFFIPPL